MPKKEGETRGRKPITDKLLPIRFFLRNTEIVRIAHILSQQGYKQNKEVVASFAKEKCIELINKTEIK